MTLNELNQLYYLSKLIDRDAEKLARLESSLKGGASSLTGMPRSPGFSNKTEETIAAICDTKEKITKELKDYVAKREAIENYIRSIEDMRIKLICTMRFIDLKQWNDIALYLGINFSEDSVKKLLYRFLEKN